MERKMTWIFIIAMVSGGQLAYSETGTYESRVACEAKFSQAVEWYREKNGVALHDINGGCYMVESFP